MTDPIYTFIKGKGWVPTNEDMATAIIHGWRVTVYSRPPVPGERYGWRFGVRKAPEILDAVIKNNSAVFLDDKVLLPVWSSDASNENYFAIVMERV